MINSDIIISNKISLLDSLKIMDQTNRKLLIVCDGSIFCGVISIGDIQRAILKKQDLSFPVSDFVREKVTYAFTTDDLEKVKSKMREEKIESMPVVDADGNLCDVIEWNQLFSSDDTGKAESVNLPVVIMAGGRGTRLLPLTNIVPKPLVPISDKTIIEEIMTRFKTAGCEKFFVSVNYMMETVKRFFEQKPEWDISFVQEKEPLGTAGSLYLLKGKVNSTFFITNCDTLMNIDMSDLVKYHRCNNNKITVVSAVKAIHIPYGTLETKEDGLIKEMKEKPDLVYQVNSGFYVFEPDILKYVEDGVFLNIPDLISRAIKDGNRVGAFPVSEGAWVDMGNWHDYLMLVKKYST